MGIGTNGHLEQMSSLEPMGIWDKWALRACGDWDKWTFGGKGTLRQRGVLGTMSIGTNRQLENGQFGANGQISKWWREVWGNVLRYRETGKGVGMCVGVWGQVSESVSGGVWGR